MAEFEPTEKCIEDCAIVQYCKGARKIKAGLRSPDQSKRTETLTNAILSSCKHDQVYSVISEHHMLQGPLDVQQRRN